MSSFYKTMSGGTHSEETKITFTPALRDRLRDHYERARRDRLPVFTFEGQRVLTSYAEYLLEYLDMKFGPTKPTGVVPECNHCHGTNVRVDAWAEWDADNQKWVLGETFQQAFCCDCDGETTLNWFPVSGGPNDEGEKS